MFKKLWLKFALICVVSLSGLISPTQIDAAIISSQINRNFDVSADKVTVTERSTLSITNRNFQIPAGAEEVFVIFNPQLNDTEADAKIAKAVPTIKVTDGANKALKYTTKQSGQNLEITVRIDRVISFGQVNTIQVQYDSYALLTQTGAIRDLYIPTFGKDYKFETENISRTISTQVNIPKSLGTLNLINPAKVPETNGNNWQLSFNQQELTDTISWIQIGNTQYYQFDIRQPYSATGNIPLLENTFSIMLPRDVDSIGLQQKVKFSEISPTPHSIRTDENGNLVADFKLSASANGEIVIRGYAEVSKPVTPDLKLAGNISDISPQIVSAYTGAAEFWEVNDPAIQAKARELKGNKTDVYEILSTTYQYVIDQIDYSEVKRFGLNQRQGALKTLQGGAAVCMEYSDLFIALMRAQGVPARAAFGYGYDARAEATIETGHQWAEVYLPKYDSWVSVDTTWGDTGLTTIGGSLNHFYKYMASIDPNTPAPVTTAYYGRLSEIAEDKFTITATSSVPSDSNLVTQAELITRYPAQVSTISDYLPYIGLGLATTGLLLILLRSRSRQKRVASA